MLKQIQFLQVKLNYILSLHHLLGDLHGFCHIENTQWTYTTPLEHTIWTFYSTRFSVVLFHHFFIRILSREPCCYSVCWPWPIVVAGGVYSWENAFPSMAVNGMLLWSASSNPSWEALIQNGDKSQHVLNKLEVFPWIHLVNAFRFVNRKARRATNSEIWTQLSGN